MKDKTNKEKMDELLKLSPGKDVLAISNPLNNELIGLAVIQDSQIESKSGWCTILILEPEFGNDEFYYNSLKLLLVRAFDQLGLLKLYVLLPHDSPMFDAFNLCGFVKGKEITEQILFTLTYLDWKTRCSHQD